MKTLLTTSLLALTVLNPISVQAHDFCNVELNGGIKINNDSIEFLDDSEKTLYKIVNDTSLIVAGKQITLTSSQQSLLTEYSSSIRAVVPEVKSIALDGIDLAIDGVNMAFNELLGENNDIGKELTEELGNMHQQIDENFTAEKGFYINEDGFDGDEIFGKDFEQRIESVVEKAVQNSMGSLLVAVGQQMMFSGGNMDAFETRMENFGQKIEHEMESRAEVFEKRGNALCTTIVAIDQLETQLQHKIDVLADVNIINASNDKHNGMM